MDSQLKPLIVAAVFALLWCAESRLPFYAEFWQRGRDRIRHDARNLALGSMNTALFAVFLAGGFALVDAWAREGGFGLLRLLDGSLWIETVAALIALDLWMYVWHRASHAIPILWRFHRVHHSETNMDATTGVRFHFGEIVASAGARLIVVTLLGIELWQLALFEVFFLPVVLFHHSNVQSPRWLDRILLRFLVTPAMHRVHHSRSSNEMNSNFGVILPYWDILLGSFRRREDVRAMELGLDGFDDEARQTLAGMILTPFTENPRSDRALEHAEA